MVLKEVVTARLVPISTQFQFPFRCACSGREEGYAAKLSLSPTLLLPSLPSETAKKEFKAQKGEASDAGLSVFDHCFFDEPSNGLGVPPSNVPACVW